MESPTPPPPDDDGPLSAPAPATTTSGSPTDFLKGVVGKRVIVRLISGVDYQGGSHHGWFNASLNLDLGVLSCLDGYMNIALEQTEEHVNGSVTNKYGDAFIRGNNGVFTRIPGFPSITYLFFLVLYISAAEAL